MKIIKNLLLLRRLVLCASVFIFLLTGCYGTIHVKEDTAEKDLDPESVARGQVLFQENCEACHGAKGRGNGPYAERFDPKPADLLEPGIHVTTTGLESIVDFPHYSSEAMKRRIRHGSAGMPEFKETFTEEEIIDIMNHIKNLVRQEESK